MREPVPQLLALPIGHSGIVKTTTKTAGTPKRQESNCCEYFFFF